MKPLDYRTYVISIVIAVMTFFLSRIVTEDHDDARKAADERLKRIEGDVHLALIQTGAARAESNKYWLEFKQFKYEKNFRDSLADRTLHRIETHLANQTTRYRRLVYLPVERLRSPRRGKCSGRRWGISTGWAYAPVNSPAAKNPPVLHRWPKRNSSCWP